MRAFPRMAKRNRRLIDAACQLGSDSAARGDGPCVPYCAASNVAGSLELLKIRRPDPKRIEKAERDFTIADYESFKKTILAVGVRALSTGRKWK